MSDHANKPTSVEEYVTSSTQTFLGDPPDSDYQRGFLEGGEAPNDEEHTAEIPLRQTFAWRISFIQGVQRGEIRRSRALPRPRSVLRC